jgi:hypothetical protein
MFRPLKTSEAEEMLEKRAFGFSHLRLLPKNKSMRFIFNMKRRVSGAPLMFLRSNECVDV